jgi:hypothetical protein
MIEHGVSSRELSAIAGVSRMAFYLKIWGIKRWKLTEVVNICCFFRTPDAEHLFVRNYNKQQFLESQEENANV